MEKEGALQDYANCSSFDKSLQEFVVAWAGEMADYGLVELLGIVFFKKANFSFHHLNEILHHVAKAVAQIKNNQQYCCELFYMIQLHYSFLFEVNELLR